MFFSENSRVLAFNRLALKVFKENIPGRNKVLEGDYWVTELTHFSHLQELQNTTQSIPLPRAILTSLNSLAPSQKALS